MLESILAREPNVVTFHKVRVLRRSGLVEVSMHLVVEGDMSVEDSHHLCHHLEEKLQDLCGPCSVIVHFEPCASDCAVCEIVCDSRDGP